MKWILFLTLSLWYLISHSIAIQYTPFVSSTTKYWELNPSIAGETIAPNILPLNMKKALFTNLYYPIYSRESYPKLTSNFIYYGLANSEMNDLCSQGSAFRRSNQTIFGTCNDFFCTSESQEMSLSQQAQMFMFCWYCIDDATDYTSTENLAFRVDMLSNPRCQQRVQNFLGGNATDFFNKDCGQENALPFIAPKHVYEIRELAKRKSKVPTSCFCYNWNAYGFSCNFYTIFMIPLAYYGSYWPLLLLGILALFIFVIFVLIPRYVYTCKLFAKIHDKKCTDIFIFVSATNQAVVWTLFALVTFCLKQFVGIFYSFYDVSSFVRGNWYHSIGVVMTFWLGLAYATLLIMWSNMVWSPFKAASIRGGLTTPHKILLGMFYLGYVGSILIIIIQYAIFRRSNYTWGTVSILVLLYMIVFPIGFTIYAFRMCCVLKNTKGKSNLLKLKYTQFVVLFNIFFVIGSAVIVFFSIDFLAGWDVYGVFIHATRNIILDILFLILQACVFYLLVDGSIIDLVYCCGKLSKKKYLQSSITDTNDVMESIERNQSAKTAKYTLLYGQDDSAVGATSLEVDDEEDAIEQSKSEELNEFHNNNEDDKMEHLLPKEK